MSSSSPGAHPQRWMRISSVQSLSGVLLFVTPWTTDAIQPFHPVIPFSSCLQSSPASGSFPMSQCFTSGGQSIGVSVSTSILPMNIQVWFPLGWTGWISYCLRDSQESSPKASVLWRSAFFMIQFSFVQTHRMYNTKSESSHKLCTLRENDMSVKVHQF